jgi:hypothetical protein
MVRQGKIQVKMTPWRSHKYLHPNEDYENYEFFSTLNPWKPQAKYLHEMDKLKFLEFTVTPGNVLYVPPYWWYSIRYQESGTLVYGLQYNSVMNIIAHAKQWALYFIQNANIRNKTVKTMDLSRQEKNGGNRDEDGDGNEAAGGGRGGGRDGIRGVGGVGGIDDESNSVNLGLSVQQQVHELPVTNTNIPAIDHVNSPI